MPSTHRVRRAAALTFVVPALIVGAVHAAQAVPDRPNITPADVQAAFSKVAAVNDEINELNEKQAEAQVEAARINKTIVGLRADYREQRDLLGESIAQAHLDSPLGPTTGLLASADKAAFLDNLRTIETVNTARSDAMASYEQARFAYEYQQSKLDEYTATLDDAADELKKKQAKLKRAHETAERQLADLTAAQQAAFNSGSTTLNFTVNASGNAKKAIDFALAQLGDRYRYGATGPDAWDCSGLVQAAWRAGGVNLPRSSGPQMNSGKPVSMSSLKPGDIVGFSRSGGHNGIYIGGGKVVHAPRSGKNVEIVNVSLFSVATRVG